MKLGYFLWSVMIVKLFLAEKHGDQCCGCRLLLATTQAFLWTKDPTVPLMTFEELCFEPLHVLRCASVVFQ